jgi:hypothetical protein
MIPNIIFNLKKKNIKIPKPLWFNIIHATGLEFHFTLELVKDLPVHTIYEGAIAANNTGLIWELLERGDVEYFYIFKHGDPEMVKEVIDFVEENYNFGFEYSCYCEESFLGACSGGHAKLVENHDSSMADHRHGLELALKGGHLDVVKYLTVKQKHIKEYFGLVLKHLDIVDYVLEKFKIDLEMREMGFMHFIGTKNLDYCLKFGITEYLDKKLVKEIIKTEDPEFYRSIPIDPRRILRYAVKWKKKNIADIVFEINKNLTPESLIKEYIIGHKIDLGMKLLDMYNFDYDEVILLSKKFKSWNIGIRANQLKRKGGF